MKDDRRVKKTKQSIKNSLIELMQVSTIDRISVTELAELADISRKTFYLHYNSIFDAAEDIDNDVTKVLSNIINRISKIKGTDEIPKFLSELHLEILNHEELIKYFMLSSNQSKLHIKVHDEIKDAIIDRIDSNLSSVEQEYGAEFLVAGLINVYTKWYKEQNISFEQLSKIVISFYEYAKVIV